MTEKRFKIHWESNQWIFDHKTGETYDSLSPEKICNVLNELCEDIYELKIENEQLKSDLKYWKTLAQSLYMFLGDVE